MTKNSVFSASEVRYAYEGGAPALDGVSLDVKEGESLTIIGTNGSGKSTLLYILNGLIRPSSGSVSALGVDIAGGYPSELRKKISLLFQNSHAQLFSLSVMDELCFGPLELGLSAGEAKGRAESVMELLGIKHLRDRGPWELSGGEMKKVALGTCLSINPDVILLDEPTSGLDPRSQVEIAELVIALHLAGKTIVTATHDLHMIEDISERTIVMGENHKVIAEGAPWQVLDDQELLLRANLIHSHVHKHDWFEHEHGHHGAHGHEHIARGGQKDEDLNRLARLIGHWEEHSIEHADTYREWASKARAMHRPELAKTLEDIARETAKLGELFKRAKERA